MRRRLASALAGLALVAGLTACGTDSGTGSSPAPSTTTHVTTHKAKPKKKPAVVVFKVWGKAPGGVDVQYGSDTDNREGPKHPGFTKKLPLDQNAEFYDISAQLMGGGDIHCSVTVDGHTKKAHASGSYNICDAQLSKGFVGWS